MKVTYRNWGCRDGDPSRLPRQDKARGVIPENHLRKVEADAMAYSFAVCLGLSIFETLRFVLGGGWGGDSKRGR